ncbi:amidophosphoribosyltransferase [Moraxella nasovis]|uniref:amidophosphoribosyltransferase n=1 Tax=Moraxella nasovis TaxID=2904121 RepID=UPI001F61EEAA|nr:amidophosphoribosyltransferase [Moraxella nasovis]UNU73169.1 amidophosphoribosyltransferase [Moraxella nasovis]
MLHKFIVERNDFLHQNVQGFYRTDYVGYQQPNNPDYLNTLKNTFNKTPKNELMSAVKALKYNLIDELNYIYQQLDLSDKLYICVVPRAKALETYSEYQLIFRILFQAIVGSDKLNQNLFGDGIDFIIRTRNTRTTHLNGRCLSIENDGDMPYVGITKDTCQLSPEIAGKHILLIDDIYTKSINIDEDVLQALLDCGAKSVTLFAIARTVLKSRHFQFTKRSTIEFI